MVIPTYATLQRIAPRLPGRRFKSVRRVVAVASHSEREERAAQRLRGSALLNSLVVMAARRHQRLVARAVAAPLAPPGLVKLEVSAVALPVNPLARAAAVLMLDHQRPDQTARRAHRAARQAAQVRQARRGALVVSAQVALARQGLTVPAAAAVLATLA